MKLFLNFILKPSDFIEVQLIVPLTSKLNLGLKVPIPTFIDP